MLNQRFTLLLILFLPLPAVAWWDCGWNNRFAISLSKPVGSPLIDYQVRLDLDSSNVPPQFDWSLMGDDLRIIYEDDQTALDIFIEVWDSLAQTAIVWVKVPSIPGSGRTLYVYFGAPPATSSASTISTFTEPGLKFHTRRSTINPSNRAAAETAFRNATDNVSGYGCTFIDDYSGVNNRTLFAPPNRNSNIGLFAEVFFEVMPGQAGVWQFRYGADFGRGGGLYVDDMALDEKWTEDLWWALNWNNTSETLQGSINLSPGYHSLRILGFEGCCDGGLTAQFQRPGGPWLDVALTNIPLISRKCPNPEPNVAYGPVEAGSCPTLTVTRTSAAFSDPIRNQTNPMHIPGAVVLNETIVSNSGTGPADAFTISEAVAANMALRVADFDGGTSGPVQFTEGSPGSSLSYSFVSLSSTVDDVEFSNNNGASYTYTPVADANGIDLNVTNIRITPNGTFQGNSGGGDPTATFAFKTVVQ